MILDLAEFQSKAPAAIKAFWKHQNGGNMNGLISLLIDLVRANGLEDAEIIRERGNSLTLPGYFRPTTRWDLLVLRQRRLVAAIKLSSQIDSSGSRSNDGVEEAMCAAKDLWAAYRSGTFGDAPCPFVGWLMLVEDAPGSRSPVTDRSPHFPVRPEFQGASYIDRYNLLCKKLVQEQLYTAAAVIASAKTSIRTGAFSDASEMTSLKTFVTSFAGHIAAEAAR